MLACKPKICFVFRYVNNLKFKKTADHTDTYVIILRKSFSLIGSDFSREIQIYTTFNLEKFAHSLVLDSGYLSRFKLNKSILEL